MQKKVNLAMLALFSCSLAMALGEDDDMSSKSPSTQQRQAAPSIRSLLPTTSAA